MSKRTLRKSKRTGLKACVGILTHRWVRRGVIWSAGTVMVVLLFYAGLAQRYDMKEVGAVPERSVVYDVQGKLYSRLYGENRIVVALKQVPKNFINALLAREDARFYQHHGVDFLGILRAALRNLTSFSVREGASTLTQQLARNSFYLGGQTLHRKLLEAMVAVRIEKNYSKDEILEAYVNRIYFGTGVYGVEAASQIYFGKSISQLSLGECAMLAGIIRSPNRFSPVRNLKGAKRERDLVLDRMVKLEMISKRKENAAKKERVQIATRRPLGIREDYAMDAVQKLLPLLVAPEAMDRGGLRIYTTLDTRLQQSAVKALTGFLNEYEKQNGYSHPKREAKGVNGDAVSVDVPEYLQGALVAIDQRTGGICAIVGGRSYQESQFNRAFQARRQLGSAFKPFVYAAAFEQGLRPDDIISDAPIRPGEIDGVLGNWNPVNSDGKNRGDLPAEKGLILSRNTMSVRVGNRVGLTRTVQIASEIGLCNNLPPVPSIYLGGFEGSPKDLVSAYTVFPNRGVLKQPQLILKIEDAEGGVIYESVPDEKKIFDESSADRVSEILEKVVQEGTAASLRQLGFNHIAAGKTGTTNDYRDAWFVGYTTSLTCGVWVGFDQPKKISSHAYGSVMALPIWARFMEEATGPEYPAESFPHAPLERKVGDFFSGFGRRISEFFGGDKKK